MCVCVYAVFQAREDYILENVEPDLSRKQEIKKKREREIRLISILLDTVRTLVVVKYVLAKINKSSVLLILIHVRMYIFMYACLYTHTYIICLYTYSYL